MFASNIRSCKGCNTETVTLQESFVAVLKSAIFKKITETQTMQLKPNNYKQQGAFSISASKHLLLDCVQYFRMFEKHPYFLLQKIIAFIPDFRLWQENAPRMYDGLGVK